MISLPPRIIRDLIQIIRLQLIPSIVEQQGWKWHVQLCLTVPPAAIPIIAPGYYSYSIIINPTTVFSLRTSQFSTLVLIFTGMPAVVISQSKFLIYVSAKLDFVSYSKSS